MADLHACRDVRYTATVSIPGSTPTTIVIPRLFTADPNSARAYPTEAYEDCRAELARIATKHGAPVFVYVEHPHCCACEPFGYTIRPTVEES